MGYMVDIQKPSICLNMIVKNESKIITRMLESVSSIIDCYCICDTGSTDDTLEVISTFFKNKNIPGKIVIEPFKNFCHNRNFALNSSKGMSDYVLLMDADMIFEIYNFNKSILKDFDFCKILQGNDSFFYNNIRIVKNNGLYKYNGVTHEYIDHPDNANNYTFNKSELFIRDIGDGGSKDDKFERDIKLLLNGISEDPSNARYHFYLANSYYDTRKYEESIPYYKKRIELGGWVQEVWYSYYRLGLCYYNLDKKEQAINYWLKGFYYYPERLEGIYKILHEFRVTSQHYLGYEMYKKAKDILDLNKNKDDYLFLENDVYTYQIYYEFTIIAYYVGIHNINDETIKVLNKSYNNTIVDTTLNNMKYYCDVLKYENNINLNENITYLLNNNEEIQFYSSSSCLIPDGDNYKMNIRYVNYYIKDNGNYVDCDKYIITINKYLELDKEFKILNAKWLDLNFVDRRYIGVEDIRLFNDNVTDELLCVGTGYHSNNTIGVMSGNYNTQSLKEIKQTFKDTNCEKNWVFVEFDNEPHILYEWYPLTICKINNETSTLEKVDTRITPRLFSKVRGSTCGFKFQNPGKEPEIWFVNHIVSYESPRHYYHIISIFDSNLNLLRYSAPFKFEGEPIEYCLSIVVENDRVIMNYSTWDRTTIIGIYDKKYIDSIVKYV